MILSAMISVLPLFKRLREEMVDRPGLHATLPLLILSNTGLRLGALLTGPRPIGLDMVEITAATL